MNKKKFYLWLGILVVVLAFFSLESINPHLFLHDDNLVQFAPTILEGMEQLFSGQIPSINLYQLMGTKILENGTYAVFYPPTILSYFFAHYIFGNDLLIFEIFALIHLIIGFAITFIFLNSKIKNNLICLLASFAFVFSGYFQLIKGWYYVAPILIFLPLIFLLNDKLNKKGFKFPIFLGVVRGIFFYSGNAQYFIYLIIFEAMYFLIRNYQKNWEDFSNEFKKYLFSWLITIILAIPLLWAQLKTSIISSRGNVSPLEYLLSRPALPTDSFLGTLIFPTLLNFSNTLFRFASLSYSGTLFSLLFFAGGIFLIKKYKKDSLRKISPLFWCGIIAMVLSWGVFGIIYSFGLLIPFLNSFQGPYKIIPFVNFFMICFGAIIFQKIIKKTYVKKIIWLIIILFLILLFSNTILMFNQITHKFNNGSPINKSLFNGLNLEDQRFITVLTNTSYAPKIDSNFIAIHKFSEADILTKNFASYYDLDHFSGKEPFKDKLTKEKIPFPATGVSNKHLNLSTLSEYGVKYFIVPKESINFHTELEDLNQIYENEIFVVLEQENVRGYVFNEEGNLDYSRKSNGFYFETIFEKEENVTINLLYKKNYIAKINGEKIPFYEDPFGRMFILIPKGENEIEFYYFPKDFVFGVFISLVLILFLIICLCYRKKIEKLYHKIHFKKFFNFI